MKDLGRKKNHVKEDRVEKQGGTTCLSRNIPLDEARPVWYLRGLQNKVVKKDRRGNHLGKDLVKMSKV